MDAEGVIKRNRSGALTLVLYRLLLVVFVLNVQFASSEHSHTDELVHHLDCAACVTHTFDSDFLAPEGLYRNSETSSIDLLDSTLGAYFFRPPLVKSRSPPAA